MKETIKRDNSDGTYTIYVLDSMLIEVIFPTGKKHTMTKEFYNKGYSKAFRDLCQVKEIETVDEFINRVSNKPS